MLIVHIFISVGKIKVSSKCIALELALNIVGWIKMLKKKKKKNNCLKREHDSF